MAEIIDFNTTLSVKELMKQISLVRYNPSLIQTTILDYLKNVTEGRVDIVDPTNPFVFLLEASAVTTAASIIENENLLRLQYPSLAMDEEELYLHMSDKDILNRFARPAIANFDVVIMKSDLLAKMVDSPLEQCRKVIIPRNTQVKVSDMYFSIEYPIEIRQMYHGGIHVIYDVELPSKIYTVSSAMIKYDIRRDNDLTEWLVFKLPMYQFRVESHQAAVTNSSYFEHELVFPDQFYTARVYYTHEGVEKELRVSLTDQVYDPKVPTAVLKVQADRLLVNIPRVYIANDIVTGTIRIDVYSTRGEIAVDLSNYKLTAFETNLTAFNKERDLSDYTNAMSQVIALFSCSDYINAGDNALSFTELKDRLINNSLAGSNLPITNKQLEGKLLDGGFELISNTDVITNRIFIASRRLPLPIDDHLYVPLDSLIGTYYYNNDRIKLSDRVIDNGTSFTIRSNSLFEMVNGQLELLHSEHLNSLLKLDKNELTNVVNEKDYYFSPFWYILDRTSDEFKVRAYHLDDPITRGSSVLGVNQNANTLVNTASSRLIKESDGYTLLVETTSDDNYKDLPEASKKAYISFRGNTESNLYYIEGFINSVTDTGEIIFEFKFKTNHWIDEENNLLLENGYFFNTEPQKANCPLTGKFNIAYTKDIGFSNDADPVLQQYHPQFLTREPNVVLMVEEIYLELGLSLDYLWKQSRSVYTDAQYRTYDIDVPMVYEHDVFRRDPVTGSIFSVNSDCNVGFEIIHYKGDAVLDEAGNPVLKHRKGDVVLDEFGNPLTEGDSHIYRLVDLLLLDAKVFFATDIKSVTYLKEIKKSLTEWITYNLADFNKLALEQTKIYFKPKITTGFVKVLNDTGNEVYVPSEQKLFINVYVKESVFENIALKENISLTIIKTIADLLNNNTVSTGIIIKSVMDRIGDSVNSISVRGLGGKDYNTITITEEQFGFSLAKKLFLKSDGNLIVLEDIEINFINALPEM